MTTQKTRHLKRKFVLDLTLRSFSGPWSSSSSSSSSRRVTCTRTYRIHTLSQLRSTLVRAATADVRASVRYQATSSSLFNHVSTFPGSRPPRAGFSGRVKSANNDSHASENLISGVDMRTRVIVWFRNDLRLLDNAVVARAATLYGQSSATTEVLPVYVFDETYFKASKRGMSRFGAGRAKFTLECVADLKKSLNVIGSDLLVRCGKTEDVFTELLLTGENTKTVILTQTEVTSEETDMDQMIEKLAKDKAGRDGGSVSMERLWGSTLYHIDDLPFNANDGLNDLPDVFTPFRNKVESKCAVRSIIPAPQANALGAVPAVDQMEKMPTPSDLPFSSQDLAASCDDLIKRGHDERAVLNFIGGESHALARVKYYIWDSDLLATYFETRNGMLGGDYSTKLAPWLALGCVSPRFVVSEIRRYESERVENKSTYWVIFELIWRDFFKFFALKHGNSIFHLDGTAGRRASWKQDSKILEAWKTGSTGYPLIDANMRELAATGFMSNRGRQNVASWLALDAGIDWRHGADWFEHHLLDYDTASNWGNWCAAAGMTGGRINRFNIAKQTKDYDPQGEYIKTWCPELAQVPAAYIADPNQAPRDLRDRLNLDYPNKIQLPYRDYTAMGSPPGGIGGRGGRGARGARGGRGGRSSKHKQNARGAHASSVYDAVYG